MRQQRTRRRFRTLPMVLLVAMVAIVVGYLRCGDGLGLGGGRGGRGEGGSGDEAGGKDGKDASRKDSEVRPAVGGGGGEGRVGRCKLRLDSKGLTLDGRPSAVDDAVAECKKAGAELTVTGDAVVGESDRLQQVLTRGGVEVFVRERVTPEK